MLAETSVAAPFVSAVAGALVIAQAIRIASGQARSRHGDRRPSRLNEHQSGAWTQTRSNHEVRVRSPECSEVVEKSRSTIGSGPVDPPTLAWRSHPEQGFHRSAACVVIERSSAPVKAACMPRLAPPEALAVEVMAKLVAKGAEERAERGDLFPDGGPHPETDE